MKEKSLKEKMGDIRSKHNGEFDFDKLPEGIYSFSGQEGFVKVEVGKNGDQSWNLENWFESLDPDKNEVQRDANIEDIKSRLNPDSGTIDPTRKQKKRSFLNPFKKI